MKHFENGTLCAKQQNREAQVRWNVRGRLGFVQTIFIAATFKPIPNGEGVLDLSTIYWCPNQIFAHSAGPESPRVGGAGEDDGDSRPHIMILISVLLWNNIIPVSN